MFCRTFIKLLTEKFSFLQGIRDSVRPRHGNAVKSDIVVHVVAPVVLKLDT